MNASHHKLDKLVGVVDRNFVQIDGRTSEVMEVDPLADKWASYGWKVFEFDGHNIVALCNAFELAEKVDGKASVIITKTKMGKGIKPIEDDFR